MNNNKKIGTRINEALAKRNISQKELADYLGVKANVISYFCSGSRTPNSQQLIMIADRLKVSTDYLLCRTGTMSIDEITQKACDITGLTENAISALIYQKENTQKDDKGQSYYLSIFSELIENEQFRRIIALLGTLREMSEKVVPLCHTPDDILCFTRIAKDLNISGEEVQKQFALKMNTIFDNCVENADTLEYIDLLEKLNKNGIIQKCNNIDKECRLFKLEVFEIFFKIVDSFDHREDFKYYNKQQLINYLNLKSLLDEMKQEREQNGEYNTTKK